MTTNVPKNAALLIVPHPALPNIFTGSLRNAFLLNSIMGIKCSAP